MIYEQTSYKDVIKSSLLERRESLGRAYTFQSLAKACRIQKTYLSRVFNGDAHLNEDQVFLACDFLGFSEDEREYALLLQRLERSVVRGNQAHITDRINILKKKYLSTESHLKADKVPVVQDANTYYLDPNMQLVHMFLTVNRFARDMTRMRQILGMKDEDLGKAITGLTKLGMIRYQDGRYVVQKDTIHLSKESPVYKTYRTMLKLRALSRMDSLSSNDTYNFSVIFTANEEVRRKIHGRFLEFLKSVEEDVKNAPAEEVYYMAFDLFNWSAP